MNLYVAETGQTGESYERCYVIAENMRAAMKALRDKYGDDIDHWEVTRIWNCDKPTVTNLSDCGWDNGTV